MMLTEVLIPTLISEGSRVQGELTFSANTQVFGVVEGTLRQESLEPLQVGRSGWVQGEIVSRGPVLIEGRVDGNVFSHTQIRLLPTAVVNGTLRAPRIDIRPGALLEGEITTGTPRASQRRRAA